MYQIFTHRIFLRWLTLSSTLYPSCRTTRLYIGATPEQQSQYNEFLLRVLVPKFKEPNDTVAAASGAFYDRGLFYRTLEKGEYRCISGPARNSLLPFLSRALKQKLVPIETEQVLYPSDLMYWYYICREYFITCSFSLSFSYNYRTQR